MKSAPPSRGGLHGINMTNINYQKGIVLNIVLFVVGLIIVGSLAVYYGYLGSSKSEEPKEEANEIVGEEEAIQPLVTCGLNVTAPLPNAKFSSGDQIQGFVNGCHWVAFEATAGSVQAVDVYGNFVSARIPLQVLGSWMQLPANFSVNLNLTAAPQTQTGFLVFQNDDPSGENPETVKIPISF